MQWPADNGTTPLCQIIGTFIRERQFVYLRPVPNEDWSSAEDVKGGSSGEQSVVVATDFGVI